MRSHLRPTSLGSHVLLVVAMTITVLVPAAPVFAAAAAQKHWSFVAPQRPTPPNVDRDGWARNAIDRFVLARLEAEGLPPSPPADPTTLMRRVTLDLTGLPPTPEQVDAFLADQRPDAYEALVDRLLASPRYGEHMARPWLDAARYADTSGYQTDGPRVMWRWRDWVIDAFNRNLSFDRFTIEQIAGDLLPDATLDQRIATGFNRNHRGNAEGGIIPEEYAVEYVVDRVDTTATVWLGLTLKCARCHEHKYDPITQREFYRVYAFFNNIPERGKARKFGNAMPMLASPTAEQRKRLETAERALTTAVARYEQLAPTLAAAQRAWERTVDQSASIHWSVTHDLAAHFALDDDTTDTAFRDGAPAYAPGRLGRAASFDGRRFIDAGNVGDFGYADKFSVGAWIFPAGDAGGAVLSRMSDTDESDGYNLHLTEGKIRINLVKRWLDDALRLESVDTVSSDRWHHVMFVYDGSRRAAGVTLYVDGRPRALRATLDDLNQSFKTDQPLRIGARGTRDRFHGRIDDVRIYSDCLPAREVEIIATPDTISDIIAIPPARRTPRQVRKLDAYFVRHHAPEPIRTARERVVALRKRRQQLVESFPTTMVMQERATPRDTYVLIRGEYDKPGEKVTPGLPAIFPPLPKDAPPNRLGFARWLVDPANPLTARVAVNRCWQMHFGTGLVVTPEDFGTQGAPPSHPRLLDWLASEFVRTGWNGKALQRRILTSATYRQASAVSPSLLARDPRNRLLARGPRYRLSAQAIRDQALAISGLLCEQLGGPSVKPYQPAGLWKEVTNSATYKPDPGAALYRRSLYTFWKRTVAPPAMTAFDAATRETCVVRPSRTNTPLQALNLMNDVTYVEAARRLAERAVTEAGPEPEQRITRAFRLALARHPSPAELRVLLDGLRHHRAAFRAAADASRKLVGVGESRAAANLDADELAAYTAVASVILNLDETITKE